MGLNVDHLMAVIAFETAGTFRADVKNGAGSSGTGLIQFMESTAKSLGTTTKGLAAMTAEDQLRYVHKYFKPHKGRLLTYQDVYMAVLWPRAIGKPDDYVLWGADRPAAYKANKGLDKERKGYVTKNDAARFIEARIIEGSKEGNVWEGEVDAT